MNKTDCLNEMLIDLSLTRPCIADTENWHAWLSAVGQTAAAFPTTERRWAAVVLLANDLAQDMPGLSLPVAYGTLARAVFREDVKAGRR